MTNAALIAKLSDHDFNREVALAMWRETNPGPEWQHSEAGGLDWAINGGTFERMAKAAAGVILKAVEAKDD